MFDVDRTLGSERGSARGRYETSPARALRLFHQDLAGALGHLRVSRERLTVYLLDNHQRIEQLLIGSVVVGALATVIMMVVRFGPITSQGLAGLILSFLALTLAGGLVVLSVALLLVMAFESIVRILSGIIFLTLACASAGLHLTAVGLTLVPVVPLMPLFMVSLVVQQARRIFHTCPNRSCSHRGLPLHVCPRCSEPNRSLWPNLLGLLWHHCPRCDARLPTLNLMGKRALERRCAAPNCGVRLLGTHAGRAPEHLVAIVGAAGSGKTNYILALVRALVDRPRTLEGGFRGKIDDPEQEAEFRHHWSQLEQGILPPKTAAVENAFLLYGRLGRSHAQLYLYDAPGEEFESMERLSEREYLSLLDGFIILVDPEDSADTEASETAFERTIHSTLGTVAQLTAATPGRLAMRAAVVISKGDLPAVSRALGPPTDGSISSQRCRQMIVEWGGGNMVRALEQRLSGVRYFVCSALGRAAEAETGGPFQPSGVLEPLDWILRGEAPRSAPHPRD